MKPKQTKPTGKRVWARKGWALVSGRYIHSILWNSRADAERFNNGEPDYKPQRATLIVDKPKRRTK